MVRTKEAPPTKAGKDLLKAQQEYKKEVESTRARLMQIGKVSENSKWEFAALAHAEVDRLAIEYGDVLPPGEKPSKEKLYEDISHGTEYARDTFKKAVLVVQWLQDSSLEEVYVKPFSCFSKMKAIVKSGLEEDSKKDIAVKVYKYDKAHPEAPYTCQDVDAMIAAAKPGSDKTEPWQRATDRWAFSDHDPRFGHEGFPHRFPGQAVQNLIWRWLPAGGTFLNACCGSGTALDAAKAMKVKDFRGFDLALSERLQKRHGDRVVLGDATKGDWRPYVPKDWKADLLLITPPYFSFVPAAATGEGTDLGNINKPDEYLAAMEAIAAGAMTVVEPGGVVAIVTRSSAEFDNPTPVPDIEHEICSIAYSSGLADSFLGRAAVYLNKFKIKDANNEGKPWLIPEVLHVHIFRRLAK